MEIIVRGKGVRHYNGYQSAGMPPNLNETYLGMSFSWKIFKRSIDFTKEFPQRKAYTLHNRTREKGHIPSLHHTHL